MKSLEALEPYDDSDGLRVIVETPKGANAKLRYDSELGTFAIARFLPLGTTYPFDWGFVPGTLADDGDPVDALVMNDQGTFPGVVIGCRCVGVLQVEQTGDDGERQRNDRLIVVPREQSRLGRLTTPKALPTRLRQELERFFLNATFFTQKDPAILGWRGPTKATQVIDEGVKAYRRKHARKARTKRR